MATHPKARGAMAISLFARNVIRDAVPGTSPDEYVLQICRAIGLEPSDVPLDPNSFGAADALLLEHLERVSRVPGSFGGVALESLAAAETGKELQGEARKFVISVMAIAGLVLCLKIENVDVSDLHIKFDNQSTGKIVEMVEHLFQSIDLTKIVKKNGR